ncbi:MAG: FAD-binding oxidoreductase [Deltaproteobacteria bacterium]|nr:FAD-binding oxidoreductase [Deltaproteobacteria bacterium]
MNLAVAITEAVAGLECSDRAPDRISYARDLWPKHHLAVRAGRIADHRPGAVAWPETTEQVVELVRWCAQEGVSVVPFGAGSGVCGAVLPTSTTLVMDLKRLRRWRRFAPEAGEIDVEAGVLGIRLEEDLEAKGHTVGHFPSSILCSTVGGWIAGRGAGQCSGRYGKIEDMVAAMECVDGRGEVVTLRRRTQGPDLTPLIIGSEGGLAVVTSAVLRLHPYPDRAFGAWSFETMERGYEAIREIYQRGLRPAVCRLYDPFDSMMARRSAAKHASATAGSKTSPTKPPSAPGFGAVALRGLLRLPGALNTAVDLLSAQAFGGSMLVLVFEGEQDRIDAELEVARRIGASFHARDLGDSPARHWFDHRYSVSYKQAPIFMAGAFADTMEVAAPWSRFGTLYKTVRKALGRHVFVMAHMSHAYPDGCSIYFTFAGADKDLASAERRYDETWRTALAAAIEAGGTLSHHHGVGRSKSAALGVELGSGVELLAGLEQAFDPHDILNPGNLLPREVPERRPLPPAPPCPELDQASLLVHVAGEATLAEVEQVLEPQGLTLGCGEDGPDRATTTVNDWLAAGAPGAPDPWLDPVDHLVAGFSVAMPHGLALQIRPSPRRAAGPDLFSLFFGTGGRAGRFHTAHLRARGKTAAPLETPIERNPAVNDGEQRWIDRATEAATRVS